MSEYNPIIDQGKRGITKEEIPHHETIFSIQEAINKAIATGKVVRFKSDKTNKELKKGIVDPKGCKLLKPDRFSNDIAVLPPGVESFDFEETPVILIHSR